MATARLHPATWAAMTLEQRVAVLTSEALVHVTAGDPDARAALERDRRLVVDLDPFADDLDSRAA